MVSTRVRDMAAASALGGTELIYADDGSSNVKVTSLQVREYVTDNRVLNFVDDFASDHQTWNTYYAAQGVKQTLFVPPGTYNLTAGNNIALITGGPGAEWVGYGASIECDTAVSVFASHPGEFNGGGLPRFVTRTQGNNTVTLVTLADASGFAVGDWVLLAGFDMQHGGYPMNNQFFEFRKVTNVDGGTGIITFDMPIKNDYKSTWPLLEPGSGSPTFVDDCGGPATIVAMPATWDNEAIFRGITFTNSNDIFGVARETTFEDCTFESGSPTPGVCRRVTFNRCQFPGSNMEFDKLAESVVFNQCRFQGNLEVQSSSIDNLLISDSDIQSLQGSAKSTVIKDSLVDDLWFGPIAYGGGTRVHAEGSRFGSFTESTARVHLSSIFSFSGGVFTISESDYQTNFVGATMVPGATMYCSGGVTTNIFIGGVFKILDVTQGGGFITIRTTMPDPFQVPSGADLLTHFASSAVRFRPHPCMSVTFRNCVGDSYARSLSRAPDGNPLHSHYWTGLITGDTTIAGSTRAIWGKVKKVVVKVHRPFTGTGTCNLQLFKGFSGAVKMIHPDLTITNTNSPKVNLAVAGTRIIDVENGIQIYDSTDAQLTTFADAIIAETTISPTISDVTAQNPSTWPIAEMEIWCDQGADANDWLYRQ